MEKNCLLVAEVAPEQVATRKTSRLFFIDHLRAALIILVVLHHVALVYGASTPFYYVEPPFTDPLAFQVLLVFVLMNQAWFMGAFFLLAGYFTPRSFDRKGPRAFLKDRLIRLGIPLVLFIFVLSPISNLGLYLMPASLTGITTPIAWQAYPYLIGLGPLWFVAMLLVFTVGYAAWRWLTRNRPPSSMSTAWRPGYVRIGIFVLVLALVSYLLRIIVPLGKSVTVLADFLSFPTIAYLPQYLSFFVVGILASRRDRFRTLPGSMGIIGFVAAILATVILFPLAFSGHLFSLEVSDALDNAMGNGHWQSAVYALWDSVLAVGICLALIPFFRRFIGAHGRVGSFLSQHSYTVFVFHSPIVVAVAYALRGVEAASLLKFGIASMITVPVCFAVAFVIRKIPGAARVF